MTIEADIRTYLRTQYPRANVTVSSAEQDAAPDRVEGDADAIVVSVETQPYLGYGGAVLWQESTATFDIRSFSESRAKSMGADIRLLAGTRAIGGATISIESEASSWSVEQGGQPQFNSVETLAIRSR